MCMTSRFASQGILMRLYPPSLRIADDEGFLPEKDLFGRKEYGEKLTSFVKAVEGSATVILDGDWGSGKTTFIKMWMGLLRKQSIPCVYIDAFSIDHTDSALLAITAEVLDALEEMAKASGAQVEEARLRHKLINIAALVGPSVARASVRLLTAGLVDLEAFSGISDRLKSTATEVLSEVPDGNVDILGAYRARKKLVATFRNSFADYAKSVSQTCEGANLVVIIDELDRCRPAFALEVIESIKHYFDVDGVVFVLSMQISQMEASVRLANGDVDAKRYLEKFYNLVARLPAATHELRQEDLRKYVQYLINEMGIPSRLDYPRVVEFLSNVAYCRKMSFRSLERVVASISLAGLGGIGLGVYQDVIIISAVVRHEDPEFFRKIQFGSATWDGLRDFLHLNFWRSRTGESSRYSTYYGNLLRGLWSTNADSGNRDVDVIVQELNLSPRTDLSAPFRWAASQLDSLSSIEN